MTQLGESVFLPLDHDRSEDCPFCPEQRAPAFTTHPGAKNDSSVLADVMDDPRRLTAKQSGARAKDGSADAQDAPAAHDRSGCVHRDATYGAYSIEAHHAISGKQAMKGHRFERWICADRGAIAADTGYSINNSENGVWLPSIPERYKGGKWGALAPTLKEDIAFGAMAAGHGQFHKGPHNISDPDDPAHPTYDKQVKKRLTEIDDLVRAWKQACGHRAPSGKPQTSWRVNALLDRVALRIAADLRSDPQGWTAFISRLALRYAKSIRRP